MSRIEMGQPMKTRLLNQVMAHINQSCHINEWVMSHVWMSPVTHMTESWHTYERVMSHIWMSHVAHINESANEDTSPQLYVWHYSFKSVTWLIDMCDMMCVWHDSLMCATHNVWYESLICAAFSIICVTSPIVMCDMTHSYVCHDSFICATRHIHKCVNHMCDINHYYVTWRDGKSCHKIMSHIWLRTHCYVTWLTIAPWVSSL